MRSSGGGSIGLSARLEWHGDGDRTAGSKLDSDGSSGGLNIGSFGTGTLTITNGGTVTNYYSLGAANIGNGAGSLGTVRVAGAGSTWSKQFRG